MSDARFSWVLLLALLPGVGAVASAQDKTKADEFVERGDYLFKSGYYFRASDSYRLALIEDPTSPWKKLAFGHSLFAVGQYGYASYALRRGVGELDPKVSFKPEIAPLFPSRRRFQQALRDLKRYVTYSPRDAAGLTVLGYVLYSVRGEERRCRDMLSYLVRLNPNDAFAKQLMKQLDRRARIPARGPASRGGHPTEILFKGFKDRETEDVRGALQSHPGVSALSPKDGPKLVFRYAGPNLDSNLRNLFASLSIPATLREVPTTSKQLRSFVAERKTRGPTSRVSGAPKPLPAKKTKKKPLKERVPVSKREQERIENEWPAPKPAKAK
ncbi:MAG: hypothetical protein JKY65_17260 [Planctomycetes bacterium]|nr:hypothetical protein [Planctomycetota bacterium]